MLLLLRQCGMAIMRGLSHRRRLHAFSLWRLHMMARRTLLALSTNLRRTSIVQMLRAAWTAFYRLARFRITNAVAYRAAASLHAGKAVRYTLNVLAMYVAEKLEARRVRFEYRERFALLCLAVWRRRAKNLKASYVYGGLAIRRWARFREVQALSRLSEYAARRHAAKRAVRYLIHQDRARGFMAWTRCMPYHAISMPSPCHIYNQSGDYDAHTIAIFVGLPTSCPLPARCFHAPLPATSLRGL